MFDMSMRPSANNPGHTYKFYTDNPIFEFGFGLSFTTFSYQWFNDSTSVYSYSIQLLMKNNPHEVNAMMQFFRVNVTNIGTVVRHHRSSHCSASNVHTCLWTKRNKCFFPFNIETLLSVAPDGSKWLHPEQYRIIIGKQHMFPVVLHGD